MNEQYTTQKVILSRLVVSKIILLKILKSMKFKFAKNTLLIKYEMINMKKKNIFSKFNDYNDICLP